MNKVLSTSLLAFLLTTTAVVDAQTNNSMSFSGSNYVDAGSNSALDATNIKTLECWVKFNNFTGTQEILSRSALGSGIELLIYNNNLAFFCMQSTSTISSFVTYP